MPTIPHMRSAPIPDRRRHPGYGPRDQAQGGHEPEDRMPGDQISQAKYADAADLCGQPSQPSLVAVEERRRRDPEEAEDGDQPALGKEIERRIMGLKVGCAIFRGRFNVFGQDFDLPRCNERSRYFKMWAGAQPQHSRLQTSAYGLAPGVDSKLRLLL